MKVGDLVRCVWQPGVSVVKNDCALPMEHTIKGEIGIITEARRIGVWRITLTQFGYTHTLSKTAFEVISASR